MASAELSSGEMWTAAKQTGKALAKAGANAAFYRASIAALAVGICGWKVDDMCIQMYESNQPFNHYNRFYKNDSV